MQSPTLDNPQVLAMILQQYQGLDPAHVHLDEATTAACLELRPKTLENWRHEGIELPFLKLGRRIQYRLSDILDYLDRNTFCTSGDALKRDRRSPDVRAGRS